MGYPPAPGSQKIAEQDIMGSIEFWRYSGGYWKAGNVVIGGKEIDEALKTTYMPYHEPFKIEYELPEEVKTALAEGKEVEARFVRKNEEHYKDTGNYYTITADKIYLELKPVFRVLDKKVRSDTEEEFFNYAEEILPERRGDIMTIAEQLRQEGKKEGMKERIAKAAQALNALKKGHSVEEVVKLTGLSVKQVEVIKKSLEDW